MNDPLIRTKLHLPPLRQDLVSRQRLTAKLNRALEVKLTLVTAPAGFGKTTLIREWVEQRDCPVAWLSLDVQDNGPLRFLLYLIYAFREIDAELGTRPLALLNAAYLPHISTVLTHLTNDLAAAFSPRLLVLDDYHVIDDQTIHEAIDFLIAHLPSNIHLIIASRSQPPLTLSRLRGQAQLLELNSADLRFTAVEVEQFFKKVMPLELSTAERTALEMRTEGWIAGVQLAGLSLQAHENKSTAISSISGTDRYIGDYLFEEVLQQQPDEVRRFLLSTSIVDSLCGELGDALLDEGGSQEMLERLERLQLFIQPLDNQRRWYRTHPLFGDLLRHRLRQTEPNQVPVLHRRASLWFEQQNRLEEAIRHGLKAQDFERTAGLIETAFERRDWVHHDMGRLLAWFETLPETVAQARPKLALAYAWLLLEIFADRWERIESHLKQAEQILTSADAKVSFSEQEAASLLAQVDLLRANQARQTGDPARVITLCRKALDRLPDSESYLRSGIIAHLASAYEDLGQMEQAGQIYAESMRLCRAANNVDGLLFAAARQIEVLRVGGQLRQAERVFDQALDYADQRTGPDLGLVYINVGDLFRERDQLDKAKACLERGVELCRPFEAWRAGVISGAISMVRLLAAEGDPNGALKLLRETEKEYPGTPPEEQARLDSVRARLLLAQGDFKAAARWAKRTQLSAADEIAYGKETDYLTLARVLIAQAALEAQGIRPSRMVSDPLKDAVALLERLHRAAVAGGRTGRIIEIRILQALHYDVKQEPARAVQCLDEALSLAEPEGYVRLFVDEGWPLYQLLSRLSTRPTSSISAGYVKTILAAFPQAVRQSGQVARLPGESLTDRELKTLRLLATELSIKDIATEMIISVSTVRTYAKRIYSKLDVHSRAEAVYRAKELNLL